MVKSSKTRRGFEALETRELMAGDVRAAMNGGTLEIRENSPGGDNGVEVTQLASGVIRVTGLAPRDGMVSRIFDGSTHDYLDFTGVTNIDIRLGDGRDSVNVNGVFDIKNISIDTASPTNTGNADYSEIKVQNPIVGRKLSIVTGWGDDRITAQQVSAKTVDVSSGSGRDQLNLRQVTAADAFYIGLGAGDDTMYASQLYSKRLSADGGDGFDTLTVPAFTHDGENNFASLKKFESIVRHLPTTGSV